MSSESKKYTYNENHWNEDRFEEDVSRHSLSRLRYSERQPAVITSGQILFIIYVSQCNLKDYHLPEVPRYWKLCVHMQGNWQGYDCKDVILQIFIHVQPTLETVHNEQLICLQATGQAPLAC